MFYATKADHTIPRGSLKLLFFTKHSFLRVLSLIILLVPFWFMVYFINFGPEIARQIHFKGPAPSQSIILGCFFVGSVIGTYVFMHLMQFLKSRKKTLLCVFIMMLLTVGLFSFGPYLNLTHFYVLMTILGVACGYPGVYTTLAAESFGTNQRATGTCVVSCVGRGSLVFINAFVPWAMTLFAIPWMGIMLAGVVVFLGSVCALLLLKETYAQPIDFVDHSV